MVCKRHAEAVGQLFHHHAPFQPRDVEDLGLPETQRHDETPLHTTPDRRSRRAGPRRSSVASGFRKGIENAAPQKKGQDR